MSQEIIDKLTKERDEAQAQVKQTTQGIQGLQAQLEAMKQMFNEGVNAQMIVRAQSVLFQKQATELSETVRNLQKELNDTKNHLSAANNKILELTPQSEAA